ncbi:uncharacterized protein LOC143920713 [Arctopsyche grandis]|uniref:uncharacterized protein LOC143920713 n=1 Tax=Arctopsyche grandis TaxID=121162 RepID=UPI00406D7D9A
MEPPARAAPPEATLRDKYTRLATEYSKMRSHLNVLKKGIFDEQAKSAELKELLRERELSLRKDELEIDSLNFRNQQLTKRVTVLQDDLDVLQSSKNAKKGKHKKDERGQTQSVLPSNDSILQEELQKKIIENAHLVSNMADKDFELSQLKLRLSDAEKQLSETDTKYKCELQKLKNHNQELAASLETALSSKEKTNLPVQGTPHRNNQIPGSINGDFISDVGSLIGSEDALSTEESHLHEQLSRKTECLAKMEQENQTLRIEYDLIKLEFESLKSNIQKDPAESSISPFSELSTVEDTSIGILGKLKSPFIPSDEILNREDCLKKYFRDKISTLLSDRQFCESLAKHYSDESIGLRAQLECMQKENNSLEDTLVDAQSSIGRLDDELQSTVVNYKQQLNMLTEHVGNLNDKLAQQFEEIQHLKESSSAKK